MARTLAPPLADDPPPPWLRPHQVVAFRRALAAVRRHSGAMVAEPVGTGKTWIALAVAARCGPEACCVVPSVLASQWSQAAERAGIAIHLTTHEAWSRGPRQLGNGLIIVDESHRFRTPGIRRAAHLAPHLVGRAGILLTATPVINSLADLVPQLRLLIRDDALMASGIASLTTALTDRRARIPHALASLVISGTIDADHRPALAERRVAAPEVPIAMTRLFDRLDRLRLSDQEASRALLRGVLAWAAGSSPAALEKVLGRYRLLLLQARDAAATGRKPSRGALYRLLAGDLQQTVLWSMMAPIEADGSPPLEDLDRLDELVGECRRLTREPDPKLERLRDILADGVTTIVFVTARATVGYLRTRLAGDHVVGWCHGDEAGIGPGRIAREQVLAWFAPTPPDWAGSRPTVLVTTDVGSEGLDLQGAGRVVHYDLPWTPARLDQRSGRVHREGGTHDAVEVVRFEVPAAVERRIALARALWRKDWLVRPVRVGEAAHHAWTWPSRLATAFGGTPPEPGVSAVRGTAFRCLLGFRLVAGGEEVATRMLVLDRRGVWHEDGATVEQAARLAAAAQQLNPPSAVTVRHLLARADRPLREAVRQTAGALWGFHHPSRINRGAIRRFRSLASTAARRRDAGMLSLVDRALDFLNRGHTLGELSLIGALDAEEDGDRIGTLLRRLPVSRIWIPPVRTEATGLIVWMNPSEGTHPDSVGGPGGAE